jgi:hypothetical protein
MHLGGQPFARLSRQRTRRPHASASDPGAEASLPGSVPSGHPPIGPVHPRDGGYGTSGPPGSAGGAHPVPRSAVARPWRGGAHPVPRSAVARLDAAFTAGVAPRSGVTARVRAPIRRSPARLDPAGRTPIRPRPVARDGVHLRDSALRQGTTPHARSGPRTASLEPGPCTRDRVVTQGRVSGPRPCGQWDPGPAPAPATRRWAYPPARLDPAVHLSDSALRQDSTPHARPGPRTASFESGSCTRDRLVTQGRVRACE